MKFRLFFPLLFLLFSPLAVRAAETEQQQILQRIEIIKQELKLLRSLLINLQIAHQGAEITAKSYLAINLSDDSVLMEKNSDESYPIASITKMMTAVIVFEEIDLNRKITLTEEMLKPYGHSPSVYLGLSINAENLLKATIIQSVNDAAESLSYFIGKERFVALMNQKAGEIGMASTIFYDAHGLNPKNSSCAQDLAKLLSYVHENHPEILNISRDNDFWLPDPAGKSLKFRNLNNFYPLASFMGGKSGYLPQAKDTFAAIFNINGNAVAIIVLYSENHQADIFSIIKNLP